MTSQTRKQLLSRGFTCERKKEENKIAFKHQQAREGAAKDAILGTLLPIMAILALVGIVWLLRWWILKQREQQALQKASPNNNADTMSLLNASSGTTSSKQHKRFIGGTVSKQVKRERGKEKEKDRKSMESEAISHPEALRRFTEVYDAEKEEVGV